MWGKTGQVEVNRDILRPKLGVKWDTLKIEIQI